MAFDVRVMHDSCRFCDYLAAQTVMEAQAGKRDDNLVVVSEVPAGKIFPQIAHAAHAIRIEGDQDWKLIPTHMDCEECAEVGQEAKLEAVEKNAIWFSRIRVGMSAPGVEDGNVHQVKAIRVR